MSVVTRTATPEADGAPQLPRMRLRPSPTALMLVAIVLLTGFTLLLGYAIVIPVLGHATWHLYRKLVPRVPI